MTEYRPKARCPRCNRAPNVNFSAREVERAKRDRQAARITSVTCQRCGGKYWIRAREIAAATADPATNGNGAQAPAIPRDFPERDAVIAAGFETVDDLRKVGNLATTKGIGPIRAKVIREALDSVGVA